MTFEPTIISRDAWGHDLPPKRPLAAATHVHAMVWHHSVTPIDWDGRTAVRKVYAIHMANLTNDYSDIAYNFLIDNHGTIFEGRGWFHRNGANGIHPLAAELGNENTISCCILGNYMVDDLTLESKRAMAWLASAFTFLTRESRNYGHRDLVPDACPGDAVYVFVKSGLHIPEGTVDPPPPPIGTGLDLEEVLDLLPELRQGAEGIRVRNLQALLQSYGAGQDMDIDGNFGPSTVANIKKFRESRGLRNLDGSILDYCDKGLWRSLLTLEA